MDQGQLGLSDSQYWENLDEGEETILEKFAETDFLGLVLDGPRQVQLSDRPDLPLVGVRASSIRDNVMVSLHRRLIVVVSRLQSDEVCAATAFWINDDARRTPTPKDEARLPKGRTVKVFRISANERIEDLPWRPGTLQAHLLLFDQRSNPVTVTLVGDSVQDPAVRDFLAAQRRSAYPPAIWPPSRGDGTQLHPYHPRPDSPPLPDEAAIALVVDRVVVRRARASCILRGSFALPVLERDVVRPQPPPAPGGDPAQAPHPSGWVDVGDQAATAVLPVTLLLSGDTVADPIMLHLQVPTYGAIPRGPGTTDGALATGHFAVDLFALLGDALEAQTYAVWAISRAVISQPVVVGVVTEDMLPPPD